MERRIKQKVEAAFAEFKDHLRTSINENIVNLLKNPVPNEKKIYEEQLKKFQMELIQLIYNHESLVLSEDDFKKRKRIKNNIDLEDRCKALRANKQQCTRRKLSTNDFCGTHLKGQPHGIVTNIDVIPKTTKTISVWAEDIKGIYYYIDNNMCVYDSNDILTNKSNPKIIAKYQTTICEKTGNTIYSIPEFNI